MSTSGRGQSGGHGSDRGYGHDSQKPTQSQNYTSAKGARRVACDQCKEVNLHGLCYGEPGRQCNYCVFKRKLNCTTSSRGGIYISIPYDSKTQYQAPSQDQQPAQTLYPPSQAQNLSWDRNLDNQFRQDAVPSDQLPSGQSANYASTAPEPPRYY